MQFVKLQTDPVHELSSLVPVVALIIYRHFIMETRLLLCVQVQNIYKQYMLAILLMRQQNIRFLLYRHVALSGVSHDNAKEKK